MRGELRVSIERRACRNAKAASCDLGHKPLLFVAARPLADTIGAGAGLPATPWTAYHAPNEGAHLTIAEKAAPARRAAKRSPFFVLAAIFVIAIAFIGFSKTFFLPVSRGSFSPPPAIWTEISPCAPPIVAVPVTVTEVGVVGGGGATEVGAAAVVNDAVGVGATG